MLLGHRPALDGLRGVAIALVVASHLELAGFRNGGLTGVTIFFGLSGYLITSLLLEEQDRTGRIGWRRFYARRALRLLPALLVLVAIVGTYDFVRQDNHDAPLNALAAIFYVANIARMAGSTLGLLGHTWSLAIEEQFYVLLPLALVAFGRRRRGLLVGALVLAGVVVVERVVLSAAGVSPARIQFGTDTRADAILLGCALAVACASGLVRGGPRWLLPASAVSIALVTALDAPAGLVLTVTAPATAAMVATLLFHPTVLLTNRLAVWLGRRSYGLYLWHIPIVWITPGYGPHATRKLVVLAMALVATELSYRVVEQPFLRLKERLRPPDEARAVRTVPEPAA